MAHTHKSTTRKYAPPPAPSCRILLLDVWILFFFNLPLFLNPYIPYILTPKILKMCNPIVVTLIKMQPLNSQSSCENATASSGTYPFSLLLGSNPSSGPFLQDCYWACEFSSSLTCPTGKWSFFGNPNYYIRTIINPSYQTWLLG